MRGLIVVHDAFDVLHYEINVVHGKCKDKHVSTDKCSRTDRNTCQWGAITLGGERHVEAKFASPPCEGYKTA